MNQAGSLVTSEASMLGQWLQIYDILSYIWKNLVVEEMDVEFIRLHTILVISYKYMCSNYLVYFKVAYQQILV